MDNGRRLIVTTTGEAPSATDDQWFIHADDVGPCDYGALTTNSCFSRLEGAVNIPDSDSYLMRLVWEPPEDDPRSSWALAQWGDEIVLSTRLASAGATLLRTQPAGERHLWTTHGGTLWGLPLDPGGQSESAVLLRLTLTPEVSIQEYAEVAASSYNGVQIGDRFVARLPGAGDTSWSSLDLNLPSPKWEELPHAAHIVRSLGMRGLLLFEHTSADWLTDACTPCRYVAVEDAFANESRQISGEVSGADLPTIADRVTGWIRSAPDGLGILSGVDDSLTITSFDEPESPRILSRLDSPGAYSLPASWTLQEAGPAQPSSPCTETP